MMKKLNCWEYWHCGREPGGAAEESGVCPAALEMELNGVNDGVCGGRACWAVSKAFGTCWPSTASGEPVKSCLKCPFYEHVAAEEGAEFKNPATIFALLGKPLDETASLLWSDASPA